MHFISLLIVGGLNQINLEIDKICSNLLKVSNWQSHPDIAIVNSLNKNSIGIQQIKELQNNLQKKPYQASQKIAIIQEAEKLTTQAQNAMLKLLEEPPRDTQIILTAGNQTNLLPTIISRCDIVYVGYQKHNSNEFNYVEIILKNNLNRFLLIDKILKEKNSKLRYANISKLLNDVYLYFKSIKFKHKNVYELIKKTEKYHKNNVNQKLLLENFLVNLPQI